MPDMTVRPGERVEVCSRFRRVWVSGFEVVDVLDEGYRLRRLSDRWILPALFPSDEVRPTAGTPRLGVTARRAATRVR
jgi:hypothetical protein